MYEILKKLIREIKNVYENTKIGEKMCYFTRIVFQGYSILRISLRMCILQGNE